MTGLISSYPYTACSQRLSATLSARYWFITGKGGFDGSATRFTRDDVEDILTGDLQLVHDMIRAGYFPPRTPTPGGPIPFSTSSASRPATRLGQPGTGSEITDYVAKYGAAQS